MTERPTVTLSLAMSLNAKLTDGDRPLPTSHADQEHFKALKLGVPVLIMGRKTWDTVRGTVTPDGKPERIVFTRSPHRYRTTERRGALSFTDLAPSELLGNLYQRGVRSVLLAGGMELANAFHRACAIDRFYLTVEPQMYPTGLPYYFEYVPGAVFDVQRARWVPDSGTVILEYTVSYDRHSDKNS